VKNEFSNHCVLSAGGGLLDGFMEAMEAAETIIFDYSDNQRPNIVRAFSRSARARVISLAWSASSYREGLATISAIRLRAALIRLRLAFVPERPISRKRILRRLSTSVSAVLATLVLVFVPTSAVHQLSYNNTETADGTVLATPLVGAYVPAFESPVPAIAHFERLDTGGLVTDNESTATSRLDFEKTARGITVWKDIPIDILLFAPPLSQESEQAALTESAYEEPDFASVDLSGETVITIEADNLSYFETAAALVADFADVHAADTAQAPETDFAGAQEADTAQAPAADFADAQEADTAQAPASAYIWPASCTLTSRFGYRSTSVGSSNHKGIDLSGPYGDSIYAAGGGEVIVSGWSNSFGYVIQIQHDNGDVTLYSHCSKLLVSVGERVDQGQEIAKMGQTGIASGVHLHFELIVGGVNVNPLSFLP